MPDDVAARDVGDVAPPPATAAPSPEMAAASALLEEVARAQGVAVRRLDPETLVCGGGGRRTLFHGLTSSGTSKLAQVLCGNDAWLRAHLARHGLPVVPTRLVAADDARFAEAAAQRLGFPVRMRPMEQDRSGAGYTATDVASFHESWRALTASCEPAARMVLDHPSPPPTVVAVAGEMAWVLGDGAAAGAAHTLLAVRAAAVLGAGWAVVRLAGSSSPLVDTVSLDTSALAALPAQAASRVAGAVLRSALG